MLEGVLDLRGAIVPPEMVPNVTNHMDQPEAEAPSAQTPSSTESLPHNGDAQPSLAAHAESQETTATAERPPEEPSLALTTPAEQLERRVQYLEQAVAALQVRVKEERITMPPPEPAPRPPEAIPVATPAPTAIQTADAHAARARRPWLLWEIVAEFRVILRMFVDPRYSMSWWARMVPLVLVVAILTSGIWGPWSYIPVLGWLLDKCITLAMAFVLFKVLGHEARRYRETSPDLPLSLRL
jgi:hypothetical protein